MYTRLLFYGLYIIIIAFLFLLLYSLIIEPNYIIKKVYLDIGLSKYGKKFAFISDLHFGAFSLPIRWKKAIKMINETKPDLIIIGGDLLGSRNKKAFRDMENFIAELSKIAKVIIVPGNWDYYERAVSKEEISKLENITNNRVIVLINDLYEVSVGKNESICIYGMDWLNPEFKPFPKDCKINIVVMHSPGYYKYIPKLKNQNITIILSGHTHCGQVNIFGKRLYIPDNLDKEGLDCGLKRIKNIPIYITSGLGVHSLFPFRFNQPPEIVIIK